MVELRTQRTIITDVNQSDARFIYNIVNTDGWLHFIGDRSIHDITQAQDFLEQGFLKSARELGFGYYAIRSLKGEEIGICGFLKKPFLSYVDFGFALLPKFYRQGYAYEAAQAILELGYHRFKLYTLNAVTQQDNVASQALLRKLGFIQTGKVKSDPASEKELLVFQLG